MKVLHVWNTAFSPATLAKIQRANGIEAYVYDLWVDDPTWNFYQAKNDIITYHKGNMQTFFKNTIDRIKLYDYDIISLSDPCGFMIPILKNLYPDKPVIMTYRGGYMRVKKQISRTQFHTGWDTEFCNYTYADAVCVSNKEVLEGAPKHVQYIPNTIDYEHCTRQKDYEKNTAFWVRNSWIESADQVPAEISVKEYAIRKKIKLNIQNRNTDHYPYNEYPRFMEKHEYYFEYLIGFGNRIRHDLGRSALQMLALGGKVINWGKVYKKLPKENEPKRVHKKWLNLYSKLLQV